jgi:hypothetical protein
MRTARRAFIDLLLRSPVVMRLANRLVADAARAAATEGHVTEFRSGRYFADGGASALPVVAVVATGLREGDAEHVAREFEHAQVMAGSFRPLFVIDNADFAPFRSRGYAVERVMRADELAAANPDDSYGEYVFTRLQSISRDYGVRSVVPVSGQTSALDPWAVRLVGAVVPRP